MTSPFSAWENFYVIVGPAGAALTGLQFVVIALVTELRTKRTTYQTRLSWCVVRTTQRLHHGRSCSPQEGLNGSIETRACCFAYCTIH